MSSDDQQSDYFTSANGVVNIQTANAVSVPPIKKVVTFVNHSDDLSSTYGETPSTNVSIGSGAPQRRSVSTNPLRNSW